MNILLVYYTLYSVRYRKMSFRKASSLGAPAKPTPIGCKLSTHNSEILVSSGVSALDDIIGNGGIPLHSSTMIKADRFTGYTYLLLKYFVSQGLSSMQPVILVSLDEDPLDMMKELPLEVKVDPSSTTNDDGGEVEMFGGYTRTTGRVLGATRADTDKMRIAWRYQNLPRMTSALGANVVNSGIIHYCCNDRSIVSALLQHIRHYKAARHRRSNEIRCSAMSNRVQSRQAIRKHQQSIECWWIQ